MRRLTLLLWGALVLMVGCAKPDTPPLPPQIPVEQPAPKPEPPEVRLEDLNALPTEVRAWVERFRPVEVGVARTFGDRTYLLVSAKRVCPEKPVIDFRPDGVQQREKELVVTASFSCVTRDEPLPSYAVGSMPATQLPVRFELQYSWLPAFHNPHGVPEVSLPPTSSGVIVEPQPGAELEASVQVRGFASRLFEGAINLRLVTDAGHEVVTAHGTAAGGMGLDWGSFAVELDTAEVPPGAYWLELGDYSMRDGTWRLMHRIRVTRR